MLYFIVAFAAIRCKPVNKLTIKKQHNEIVNKGIGTKGIDAIKNDNYDTLFRKNSVGFKSDSLMIAFFKPYFVKDICVPGNHIHPYYTELENKGMRLIPIILNRLQERAKSDLNIKNEIENKLGSVAELKNCQVSQVMIYYITPNVVLYDDRSSINNFYNLDTTSVIFCILHNNKLIELVTFKKDVNIVKGFDKADSLSFHKVLSRSKNPIALKNDFQFPSINVSNRFIDCFGYTENAQLFLSICTQEHYYLIHGNTQSEIFQQNCSTKIAESYFINELSPTLLNQRITQAYNRLIKNLKINID